MSHNAIGLIPHTFFRGHRIVTEFRQNSADADDEFNAVWCSTRRQTGRSWARRATIESKVNESSHCLQPIVADAPLAAVGITEQTRGREQEPAPAPHPQARIVAMDLAQDGLDHFAMGVESREPVLRGALVVSSAPAPFLLDRKQIAILPDQMMARHHPAAEEVLGDPFL